MAYGERVTTTMRWRGRGEGTTKTTAGGWRYAGDVAGEGGGGGGGGGLQATPPTSRPPSSSRRRTASACLCCAARWGGGIENYGSLKEGEGDKEFDGVTKNSMGVSLN
jgi:hypothetical protein